MSQKDQFGEFVGCLVNWCLFNERCAKNYTVFFTVLILFLGFSGKYVDRITTLTSICISRTCLHALCSTIPLPLSICTCNATVQCSCCQITVQESDVGGALLPHCNRMAERVLQRTPSEQHHHANTYRTQNDPEVIAFTD